MRGIQGEAHAVYCRCLVGLFKLGDIRVIDMSELCNMGRHGAESRRDLLGVAFNFEHVLMFQIDFLYGRHSGRLEFRMNASGRQAFRSGSDCKGRHTFRSGSDCKDRHTRQTHKAGIHMAGIHMAYIQDVSGIQVRFGL